MKTDKKLRQVLWRGAMIILLIIIANEGLQAQQTINVLTNDGTESSLYFMKDFDPQMNFFRLVYDRDAQTLTVRGTGYNNGIYTSPVDILKHDIKNVGKITSTFSSEVYFSHEVHFSSHVHFSTPVIFPDKVQLSRSLTLRSNQTEFAQMRTDSGETIYGLTHLWYDVDDNGKLSVNEPHAAIYGVSKKDEAAGERNSLDFYVGHTDNKWENYVTATMSLDEKGKLSFGQSGGKKIALWDEPGHWYGLGISGNSLDIHFGNNDPGPATKIDFLSGGTSVAQLYQDGRLSLSGALEFKNKNHATKTYKIGINGFDDMIFSLPEDDSRFYFEGNEEDILVFDHGTATYYGNQLIVDAQGKSVLDSQPPNSAKFTLRDEYVDWDLTTSPSTGNLELNRFYDPEPNDQPGDLFNTDATFDMGGVKVIANHLSFGDDPREKVKRKISLFDKKNDWIGIGTIADGLQLEVESKVGRVVTKVANFEITSVDADGLDLNGELSFGQNGAGKKIALSDGPTDDGWYGFGIGANSLEINFGYHSADDKESKIDFQSAGKSVATLNEFGTLTLLNDFSIGLDPEDDSDVLFKAPQSSSTFIFNVDTEKVMDLTKGTTTLYADKLVIESQRSIPANSEYGGTAAFSAHLILDNEKMKWDLKADHTSGNLQLTHESLSDDDDAESLNDDDDAPDEPKFEIDAQLSFGKNVPSYAEGGYAKKIALYDDPADPNQWLGLGAEQDGLDLVVKNETDKIFHIVNERKVAAAHTNGFDVDGTLKSNSLITSGDNTAGVDSWLNGTIVMGGEDGVANDANLTIKEEYYNNYALWVKKGIVTEDIAFAPANTWNGQANGTTGGGLPVPDYVFAEDYQLRSLEDLKAFIDQNSHLPEIPSAKEINSNGFSLITMDMNLLKKIEELVLYTLDQEAKLKTQEQQLEQFGKELEALKAILKEQNRDNN